MFAGFNREVRNSLRTLGLRISYGAALVRITAEQVGASVAANIDLLLAPRGAGAIKLGANSEVTITPSTWRIQSSVHAQSYLILSTTVDVAAASAIRLLVNASPVLAAYNVGTGGNPGISIGAAATEFSGVGTRIGGDYYHQTIFGNREGYNDSAQAPVIVSPGALFSTNVTNIAGAHTYIKGGNGASGSAGAANGGNVYLYGGTAYGTGVRGTVHVGVDASGNKSRVQVRNTAFNLNGYTSTAADPTTTELPIAGDCGIHKNTTSGTVYLAYNDGGTIKKVALA